MKLEIFKLEMCFVVARAMKHVTLGESADGIKY